MTTATRDTLVAIIDSLGANLRADLVAMRATASLAPARGHAPEHARSLEKATLRMVRVAQGASDELRRLQRADKSEKAAATPPVTGSKAVKDSKSTDS